MEITPLGAAREVGRSAFLIKGNDTKLLLDFGVLMQREPVFPVHVQPKDVDAILLTHAHLDHSGAAPLFYLGEGKDLYATPLTIEIAKLLIEDFLKISGFYLPFEFIDLLAMMKRSNGIGFNERFQLGEFAATFLEGGHIPGGGSIILENGGKRVLYTGDIDSIETKLLRGAVTSFGELDAVITESTYSMVDHPSRVEVESQFVAYAKEVVERGGTMLVPAFAVGRAQEIACVLKAANFPYPVAMDGMALKTNEILFRHQEYLREAALFRSSIENLELVTSWSQRRRIVETPGVIISPAGMLVGGASVFYIGEVAKLTRNAITIVSFQVPGTPGRTLLEKGLTLINGRPKKVKAEVRRFDFSAHSGRRELFEMFEGIKGGPKVLTIHGDEESCIRFATELHERFGLDAQAPLLGQKLTL